MQSGKDITEAFRIMRLSSRKDREHFERLGESQIEKGRFQSYIFIRADNNSTSLEVEEEDAKLE